MSHLSGPPDPDGPPPYAGRYAPPPPYVAGHQAPPTNGKAQAALWTGVVVLLLSLCGVGIFGFVPITLGVLARREIRRGGDFPGGRGTEGPGTGGDGMALAGIVTGAVAMVLSVVVIVVAVVLFAVYDSGTSSYGTTGV
jgi:hypothetical protein